MIRKLMRCTAGAALLATLSLPAAPVLAQDADQAENTDAAPSLARGAAPDNVRVWAGLIQQNYPSEALRAELEGTAGVRVEVGPDGRVQSCTVTSSSGHGVLDDAACSGMTKFARFHPALDEDGNPTVGTYSTRITYSLGAGQGAAAFRGLDPSNLGEWAELIQRDFLSAAKGQDMQGAVVLALAINGEGRVSRCRILLSDASGATGSEAGGDEAFGDFACRGMFDHALFERPPGDAGVGIEGQAAMIVTSFGGESQSKLDIRPLKPVAREVTR